MFTVLCLYFRALYVGQISLAVNAVIGSCKWLVDPPNGHVVHDSGADDSTDIHIALMRSPDPIQKTKRRYV
jgi:hypothetical protein